jgi:hypothetical protein
LRESFKFCLTKDRRTPPLAILGTMISVAGPETKSNPKYLDFGEEKRVEALRVETCAEWVLLCEDDDATHILHPIGNLQLLQLLDPFVSPYQA